MFKTYQEFTKAKFDALPAKMKVMYGSEEKYAENYFRANGLEEWLKSNSGFEVSVEQTVVIAEIYFHQAKRPAVAIAGILVGIARLYDVEFPAVEGILSTEYWEKHFAVEH